MPVQGLKFYFDPLSPQVYSAFKRIQALKKLGLNAHFIPVSIFMLHAASNAGESNLTVENLSSELEQLKKENFPVLLPQKYPFNTLLAQRLCVALDYEQEREMLASAFIDAAWEKGLNLENEEYLKMIALSLGINADELWHKAFSLECKEILKRHSQRALQLGIKQVPALKVDEEIYQGQACLDFLDKTLQEYSEVS